MIWRGLLVGVLLTLFINYNECRPFRDDLDFAEDALEAVEKFINEDAEEGDNEAEDDQVPELDVQGTARDAIANDTAKESNATAAAAAAAEKTDGAKAAAAPASTGADAKSKEAEVSADSAKATAAGSDAKTKEAAPAAASDAPTSAAAAAGVDEAQRLTSEQGQPAPTAVTTESLKSDLKVAAAKDAAKDKEAAKAPEDAAKAVDAKPKEEKPTGDASKEAGGADAKTDAKPAGGSEAAHAKSDVAENEDESTDSADEETGAQESAASSDDSSTDPETASEAPSEGSPAPDEVSASEKEASSSSEDESETVTASEDASHDKEDDSVKMFFISPFEVNNAEPKPDTADATTRQILTYPATGHGWGHTHQWGPSHIWNSDYPYFAYGYSWGCGHHGYGPHHVGHKKGKIAKKDKQSNAVCRDYILIPATPRAEMVAPMMGDQTGTTRQNVISKDVACNDNDPQCAARQVIGSMAGGSMFGDGMGGLGMGFPGVPGIHTGISGYNEAGGFGDHMGHGGCGGHGGCHGGHGGYGGFGSHFFGANDHGYSSFWGGRDDIPNAEYEPLHSEVGSKKGTVSSKKKSKSHKKSFAGGWGGTGYGGYGANGLGGGDITTGEPMFGNRMDAANGEGAFGHNFEGANGWGAFGGQRWGENFAGWGHGYEGGFGGGSNGPLGFGGAEGGPISGRGVGLPSIAGPVEGGEPADGGYGANVDARVLGGRLSGPLGLGGGLGGYSAGVGAGLAGGLGGPLGGLGTAGLGGYGGVGGAHYGGYGLGGSALAGDATGYGGVGDTVGAGIGGVGAGTGIGGVGVGGVGVGGVGVAGLGDGCVGNMVNVNSGCGGAGLDGAVGGGGLAGAGAGYGVATGLNTDVGIMGTVSSGGHHTKFAFRSKVKGKKVGKAGKKSKVKATARQDIAMPDEQALMDVTKQRQLIGSLGASTLFADNVGGMGLGHPGVPQMSSGVAGIPGEYGGSGGYSHGWNGEEPGEHPHGYNQYGYGFGRHGGGVGEAGQGKSDTPQEPQEEQSSDNAQKKQFINAGPLGSLGPNPIADGISARLKEGPLRTGRIGALAVPVRKFADFGPRDGEGCYGDHCNDDYPTGPYPDGPADADFAPADVGDGVVHGVSIKQTHIKGRVAAATQVPVNVPAYAADVDSPVEGVVEEHRLGPIHSRVHHVAAVKELRIKEARPVAAIPVDTDCSVGPCDEPALEDGPVDNTLVGGHVEGAVVTHEAAGVVGAAAPVEDGLVGPIAGPVGHMTRVTHHRRIYGNRFGGPVLHHTQRVTQSVAAVPVLEDTKDPKHVHVGVGTPNVKVEVETDRKSEVSEVPNVDNVTAQKMSEIKKIVSDVTSKIKKADSKLKALKKSKTPKNGGKRQITPAFTPVTSEPAGVPDIRYPVPAADRYPLGAGYIWPSANYGHQYGGPYAWSKSSTPKAEAKKDKKKDKKGKKKSSTKTKRAAEVETKEKNETKSEDKKATKRQFLPHAGPAGMGFEHPAAGGSNYPYHGGNMDVYVY